MLPRPTHASRHDRADCRQCRHLPASVGTSRADHSLRAVAARRSANRAGRRLPALAGRHLRVPARKPAASRLQHVRAVHVRQPDRAGLRDTPLSRLLFRLRAVGRRDATRLRSGERRHLPDDRRFGRNLRAVARLCEIFPAQSNHAAVSADPDVAARVRVRLCRARAHSRRHRDAGRRRALRAPRWHDRRLRAPAALARRTTVASLSTCAIVPPELLRRIAQNGTRPQREAALATLAADQSLRFARATAQLLGAGARRITLATAELVPHRTVFDAGHRETLPGKAVRVEGQRAGRDVEVNEAYDGLGATFDFFAQVYDRNSVDVIGHELTHGITADEANLVYLGQAGALNESISDVFGSLVKQYKRGETAAEADWLIGEGLFTRRVKGVALRSMKAPGTAFDDP